MENNFPNKNLTISIYAYEELEKRYQETVKKYEELSAKYVDLSEKHCNLLQDKPIDFNQIHNLQPKKLTLEF